MNSNTYSQTPLLKKLGIREGFVISLENIPDNYFDLLQDWPSNVSESADSTVKKDLIHYFCTSADQLQTNFPKLKAQMKENGCIWISWPKQSSGAPTDLNGNIVREIGLGFGLVDVKVCSVDSTWSALKFMKRIKDRE